MTASAHKKVSDILAETIVSKSQLDIIAQKLVSGSDIPIILASSQSGDVIQSSIYKNNFQTIYDKFQNLYGLSNDLATLLDGQKKLLGSDIKSLSDQLSTIETQANNFAFLLADGHSYDYSFIEAFHDELNRDSFPWPIPDRDQQPFDPISEQATVRSDEGALVLVGDFGTSLPLQATIVGSNINSFIVSDTGINNVLISNSGTGWRQVIRSSNPITSSLQTGELNPSSIFGAQVLIEFSLPQAAPVSEIKIAPFSDLPLELIQIALYSSQEDQSATLLLDVPKTINSISTFQFPIMGIARFRILINQPIYTRVNTYVTPGETDYSNIYENVIMRYRSPIALQDFFEDISQEDISTEPYLSLARHSHFNDNGDEDLENILDRFQTRLGPYRFFTRFTALESLTLSLFSKFSKIYNVLFSREVITAVTQPPVVTTTSGVFDLPMAPIATQPNSNIVLPPTFSSINFSGSYTYNLGLQYVGVGISVSNFKGVFVSKPFSSSGDMGEIQIKTSEFNYESVSQNLDNDVLTSIEYSISNQSNPQNESDWTPILPIGMDIVRSERFFPNISGAGFLRFAAEDSFLYVFKNGYNFLNFSKVYDQSSNLIIGLRLDNNLYTSDDVFTVEYLPNPNNTIINYANFGFSDIPLTSSHDNIGAGEGFNSTDGNNMVQLSKTPFIDPNQIQLLTYAPIVVILRDGTTAINLTNYSGSSTTIPAISAYTYTNSGNVLLFNTSITQPFRVYYQYLQNNVRIRVVERVNSKDFVSPKVNYFQIKAKTRRSNATMGQI